MMMIGAVEILIMILVGVLIALPLLSAARGIQKRKRGEQVNAFGERLPAGDSAYDRVRARVERRYRRRYELAAHVLMYLFIMVGLAFLRLPPPALGLLAGAWGLVLAVHALQLVFAEFSDRAIEREIERDLALRSRIEKPKRGGRLELSDDGEVVEVVENDWDFDDKQKRRG